MARPTLVERLPTDLYVGDIIVEKDKRHGQDHKVKDVSLCGMNWRTHIHIDGMCFDGRIPVHIRV